MDELEKCNIHSCLQASNKRLIVNKHKFKLHESLHPPSQSNAVNFAVSSCLYAVFVYIYSYLILIYFKIYSVLCRFI